VLDEWAMTGRGTLLDILRAGAASRPAVLAPGGLSLSYAELRRAVEEAADGLAEFGISRGDRLAMVYPNGAEAVVLFLAASVVATACPLNPAYKEDELRFFMADLGARALLVPPGGGEEARRSLPEGAFVIEASLGADGRPLMESSAPRAAGRTAGRPDPDHVALVLHTSGTTSRPKRVALRHRNLVASVENIAATYELTGDDVSLAIMPLFHVHGLVASALSTLGSGGTVVTPARFNALRFWSLAESHRATWFSAAPAPHQMVLGRAREARPTGAAHLRFVRSCSAALTAATMAEMEERYGVPVLEAYGMTEAAHQMASNPLPPELHLPGTVGRGTGVRIGIMADSGRLLAPGAGGEVVVQGPNVIDAYESNPEANASAFTDGWFRTGDRGVIDESGYLRLTGRIKELINRGGEKVAPGEIDEVLEGHPSVREAVTFGVPHPTWGEEVAAAVVVSGPVSVRDLQRWCRERLADFKVPKVIHIVDAIPRTATGKIQRGAVATTFTSNP
jgi:acyl-CoA synthetase (AMP-forming)/AMP-acid ligase II